MADSRFIVGLRRTIVILVIRVCYVIISAIFSRARPWGMCPGTRRPAMRYDGPAMSMQTGRALLGEFVGTFALIFIGAGSIVTNQWTKGALGLAGIAAAHALVLSIMISAIGHISGGHFNPAVTFGIWVARRISTVIAALYWLA